MTPTLTTIVLSCKWCAKPVGTLDISGADAQVRYKCKCPRCGLCIEIVSG